MGKRGQFSQRRGSSVRYRGAKKWFETDSLRRDWAPPSVSLPYSAAAGGPLSATINQATETDTALSITPNLVGGYATPDLSWDFDNGVDGVKVDTADTPSAGDDSFASITENTASGGHFKYSSTYAIHGGLGLRVETGATAVSTYAQWDITGSGLDVYFRTGINLPSGTTFSVRYDFWQYRDAATRTRYALNTSRQLQCVNGSTVVGTMTTALGFDTDYRVEGRMFIDASTGILELKLFTGDSEVPDEVLTVTGLDTGTVECTNLRMGSPFAVANLGPIGFDDWDLSYTGYMGPAAAAGLSAPVNQATETDTAQPIARRKSKTLGIVTETDAAQTFTERKSKTLGITSETDTAQSIARRHAKTLGINTETDTAQAFTERKSKAIGLASGTDAAQSLSRRKSKTLGIASETDTAQSITQATSLNAALNPASETDLAQTLARQKSKTLGLPTEADVAQPIGRRSVKTLGLNSETDLAQLIGRRKAKTLGQATESNTPQAIARVKRKTLGIATETDLAQSFSQTASLAVGQASETDLAQPVARRKSKTLGLVTDASLAQSIGRRHARTLGLAADVATAQPVARRKAKGLGLATETGLAQPLGRRHVRALGLAAETDATFALGRRHRRQLGLAGETDEAFFIFSPSSVSGDFEVSGPVLTLTTDLPSCRTYVGVAAASRVGRPALATMVTTPARATTSGDIEP
jgi:hypothetical protein